MDPFELGAKVLYWAIVSIVIGISLKRVTNKKTPKTLTLTPNT